MSDSRACATLFGVGTPRTLQGRVTALGAALSTLWTFIDDALIALPEPSRDPTRSGASVAGFVLTDSSV